MLCFHFTCVRAFIVEALASIWSPDSLGIPSLKWHLYKKIPFINCIFLVLHLLDSSLRESSLAQQPLHSPFSNDRSLPLHGCSRLVPLMIICTHVGSYNPRHKSLYSLYPKVELHDRQHHIWLLPSRLPHEVLFVGMKICLQYYNAWAIHFIRTTILTCVFMPPSHLPTRILPLVFHPLNGFIYSFLPLELYIGDTYLLEFPQLSPQEVVLWDPQFHGNTIVSPLFITSELNLPFYLRNPYDLGIILMTRFKFDHFMSLVNLCW